MLLKYIERHFEPCELSEANLALTRAVLAQHPAPSAVAPEVVLSIASSSLLRARAGDPDLSPLVRGFSPLDWSEPPSFPPTEESRLLTKGRILYEHCMTELSASCVIGFFHHELTKSRGAARVVMALITEFFWERLRFQAATLDEDDRSRAEWTEVMMDHGVSYLFGVPRALADALSGAKEPVK